MKQNVEKVVLIQPVQNKNNMRLYGIPIQIDDDIYMINQISTDYKKLNASTIADIYFTDDDFVYSSNIANTGDWYTDPNNLTGWYPYNGEITIKEVYKIGNEYYYINSDEFPKEYMIDNTPNDDKLNECPYGDLIIKFKNGKIIEKTFKEQY